MNYLDSQIQKLIQKELKRVETIARECMTEALLNTVYEYYDPTMYERTGELLRSVNTKLDLLGNVTVFIDTNILNKTSAVTGENTSNEIPWLIQEGHSDGIGTAKKGVNQYHIYESRNYLEECERLLKSRLGSGVLLEVMNDNPY